MPKKKHCGASFAEAHAGSKKAAEAAPPAAQIQATNVQPAAIQQSAAPIILKQDEYTHIMTVSRSETKSKSFQASGDYTALLLNQEGQGAISLTVRDQANTIVDITAAIYENNFIKWEILLRKPFYTLNRFGLADKKLSATITLYPCFGTSSTV